MREEFEKMVVAGKIEPRHVEPLLALVNHGCCTHRSWGFGRIKQVDTVFARFTIDFPGKPDHTMDLAFAAELLKPIPKDHVLARKATELDALRQLAGARPAELLALVLTSLGGKATVDQIQQMLVPDVIREDWKKWWEGAKREMKKNGHFQVPARKSEPITYQVQEITLQDRLLAEFRAAKGLKAHLAVAGEAIKCVADLAGKAAVGDEMIGVLNTEIATHQRTQPAVALEAIFVRDELRAATGAAPVETELNASHVWAQEVKLGAVLDALPAARHRQALESFKAAFPDRWADIICLSLNGVSAKLCREFAGILVAEGRLDQLKSTLNRLISQHSATSELLLWLARDRSDVFADVLGPEVFRAMLTAMERDLFNERRSSRLRDFIVEDQDLLTELIDSADLDVVKDVTRALQLSSVFDDERDRRSLLGRILKSYPAMQALISGDQSKQDAGLIVSWSSLERRKEEYQDLVHKKIPANSKEIAIARSYGDLSENHEYKAAKEMQKLLMRRKHELEVMLARARGSDFLDARTDAVNIGTVVQTTNLTDNHTETFTLLGAWDGDPDRGILSYLAPLAQSLMGHKPGEEVDFESEHGRKRFRIESVAAYKKSEPASAPAAAEALAGPAEPDAPDPVSAPVVGAGTPSTFTPSPAPESGTSSTPTTQATTA